MRRIEAGVAVLGIDEDPADAPANAIGFADAFGGGDNFPSDDEILRAARKKFGPLVVVGRDYQNNDCQSQQHYLWARYPIFASQDDADAAE